MKIINWLKMLIPKEQLLHLGFVEITKNLFLKRISYTVKYFRDYRNSSPTSYAYSNSVILDHKEFPLHQDVLNVEEDSKNSLLIYA